jgi:hypothetical protein
MGGEKVCRDSADLAATKAALSGDRRCDRAVEIFAAVVAIDSPGKAAVRKAAARRSAVKYPL